MPELKLNLSLSFDNGRVDNVEQLWHALSRNDLVADPKAMVGAPRA